MPPASSARKKRARPARAVIVHSLADARAAVAAAARLRVPLIIESAAGAAAYAGPLWFLEVVRAARAEHPNVEVTAVLDCGESPGYALGALRAGCMAIRLRARPPVAAKIKAIARRYGAVLCRGRVRALDLLNERDPERACLDWLGRSGPAVKK